MPPTSPGPDRRGFIRSAVAAALAAVARADGPRSKLPLGIVIHSFPVRVAQSRKRGDAVPFADPLAFLEHCRRLGAAGIQVGIGRRDGEYADRLRAAADKAGMYLEGTVSLPKDRGDAERFIAEVETARRAGVTVLRTVALNGRRYEVLDSASAFRDFADRAKRSLEVAEPIAARAKMCLAVENHKDWRSAELVDLLKRFGSDHLGVCLDTGNSIALLESPRATVEALAPLTRTTHLKDMDVAEYAEGFLLAEVPLGTGFLDLGEVVRVIRKARPDVRLNLEMITRDPLKVPCLTDQYWGTFADVPGRHLAAALTLVRRHATKEMPHVADLPEARQLEAEERNVAQSLKWAAGG